MKELNINDIENIKIGQAQNSNAGTGCTVIICEKGAAAGPDVRDGGLAFRESELLKSEANAHKIHAVMLSGGSASGLDNEGGVMQYLDEHGIGYDVGGKKAPLVCQASLFDLKVGNTFTRKRPGGYRG